MISIIIAICGIVESIEILIQGIVQLLNQDTISLEHRRRKKKKRESEIKKKPYGF